MTDGEVEDAGDIPPELLGRAAIQVFPREVRPDLALISVAGPSKVTAGDSIGLDLEIQSVAGASSDSLAVEVHVEHQDGGEEQSAA